MTAKVHTAIKHEKGRLMFIPAAMPKKMLEQLYKIS
jgi:hypothetical protein